VCEWGLEGSTRRRTPGAMYVRTYVRTYACMYVRMCVYVGGGGHLALGLADGVEGVGIVVVPGLGQGRRPFRQSGSESKNLIYIRLFYIRILYPLGPGRGGPSGRQAGRFTRTRTERARKHARMHARTHAHTHTHTHTHTQIEEGREGGWEGKEGGREDERRLGAASGARAHTSAS
jgi:hypothetical protein